MSQNKNVFDVYYFKVFRFYTQFPTDNMLLLNTPNALFSHYPDALKWACENIDGLNYNVIVQNGNRVGAVK